MSDSRLEKENTPSKHVDLRKPPGWQERLRRFLFLVFRTYCVVVLMLALLQRWLIYHPDRESLIRPEDAALPSGQVHTVTLAADDGLLLRGWHVLAAGQHAANPARLVGPPQPKEFGSSDEKPAHDAQSLTACSTSECDRQLQSGAFVVLFFSGNGGNRTYRVPEMQTLTEQGANVLIFDYRGYGENPGSPSEEQLAQDAQAIWKYATKTRSVPPDRIILYGESLGGGVATRLAAELCVAGTPPAGLILRSTFSSLVDVGAYHYPWLPVRWVLLDRFSSIDRIRHVTCPILQFHGLCDEIVPIALGRRLFDAAAAASASGVRKRFVELPHAGHNDAVLVAAHQIRSALGTFLDTLSADQEL